MGILKMKAFISDFNNILLDVARRVETVTDPREADVIIIWQDVRGAMKTLCEINKQQLGKPVVVVQHGRGATRDYLAPNNFPLLADKICVWGQAEADRLAKAGYANKTVITGSPLVHWTRNKGERQEKAKGKRIVVFTPVITSHEEVENIEVALTLRKIQYDYVIEKLKANAKELKQLWHSWIIDQNCATEHEIPFEVLSKDFYPIYKLTDIHDSKLYHGEHIKTTVTHAKHLETTHIILSNADVVVGMEEGTFQLMASAMGIPTVIVDGFEYGAYGGVQEYKTEKIRTDATNFCTIPTLRQAIEEELNDPQKRKDAREQVIRNEFDPFPDKDPIELIIDVASELAGGDIRKQQEVELEIK